MKQFFTVLLFATTVLTVVAQESEQEVKSTIKQVTVFLEGAQVTRQAQVPLKSGVSVLTFTGISPNILEQSIRIEATSSVKILAVSFQVNYLEEIKKPEKIATLENERRRLLAMIAQEHSLEEVYKEEASILKTNRSIGGSAKGVDIAELKIAMDYFRQRLMDIQKQLLQIDRSTRQYKEELGKIEAQLKELSHTKIQPTGAVVVKVSTKTPVQAKLAVNYLVQEARWFPSYDIRAKDIQSPVGITYKANISQQSGEDWENVALTISSANPTQVGARPLIKPWYLGFNNTFTDRDHQSAIGTVQQGLLLSTVRGKVTGSDGKGLPGINVMIKGTTVGTVTDVEGYYSLTLTNDARTLVFSFIGFTAQEIELNNQPVVDVSMMEDLTMLNEVVVVGYGTTTRRDVTGAVQSVTSRAPKLKKTITATPVVRQTNVEFTLDDPFSIKSDGESRTTEMVEYELDALYEYYCVPKLDLDAFLIAKVLEWDEYNFLEGEASLFFEGKYIGKSILDTRNTSDTLTLSLGRDANVLVTRERVKDLSSRQLVGSNQKVIHAYDIIIRNKKAQPVTLVIEDQLPVPNTKEITVDKLEDSGGEYNDETGILKWKKEIATGKSETLHLKYAVRYPKNSHMILE